MLDGTDIAAHKTALAAAEVKASETEARAAKAEARVTYRQIAEHVKSTHGWKPKMCWIAHCKEIAGLPVRRAPNRMDEEGARANPCPNDRVRPILAAFRYFRVI